MAIYIPGAVLASSGLLLKAPKTANGHCEERSDAAAFLIFGAVGSLDDPLTFSVLPFNPHH